MRDLRRGFVRALVLAEKRGPDWEYPWRKRRDIVVVMLVEVEWGELEGGALVY